MTTACTAGPPYAASRPACGVGFPNQGWQPPWGPHRAQLLAHDDGQRLGARLSVHAQAVRLLGAARRQRQVRRQHLAHRPALGHAPGVQKGSARVEHTP